MLVKDLMTSHPESIDAEDKLQSAAQAMRSHNIGALPVSAHERLVGMITDRDIAIRSVSKGLDPKQAPVRSAMTPQVVFCFENDSLDLAAHQMKQHSIRRIVVLDANQTLVGMLTTDDLALHARGLAVDVIERSCAPGRLIQRSPWLPIG